MKKILNPYLGKQGYNCFCCAPTNPIGLHLEFWGDGDRQPTPQHRNHPPHPCQFARRDM